MCQNMLLLKPWKDLFIAAQPRIQKLVPNISLFVGKTITKPSSTIRNLGIVFDSAMTMSQHVSSICKTVKFHMRNLSSVRSLIDETTCHHAVRALITSHLDYGNSLLYGLSSKDIKRVQRLQNRAAKLIFLAKESNNGSPLLQKLHWLPIHGRIILKLLTITYNCVNETAPPYLTEIITPYQPNRTLRFSSDTKIRTKPKTRYT